MGARSSLLDAHGDDFAWSLFDAAPDGVVVVSSAGEIAFVNDAAVSLFAAPALDLLGRSVDDLVPEDSRSAHRDDRDRYRADPQVRAMGAGLLLRARRVDGSEFHAEISLSPLRLADQVFTVAAVRDVSERVAVEAAYQASQEALREVEQRVVLAEDRDRIARDLHDTVIQRLFGTGLSLQAACMIADDRVRPKLEAAITDVDEMIVELRTTIFSLQSHRSLGTGVRADLLEMATEVGSQAGFEARVRFDGPIDTVDGRVTEQLVPTLREALSNVAKHAGAHHVRVSVDVADGHLSLVVVDDGVGVRGEVLGGSGLANLAARAEHLGGTSELVALPDGGCRYEWQVPLPPAE